MEDFWTILFLAVVLKIPIFGMLGLVWWAVRSQPEADAAAEEDDGGGFRRRPRQPHGPRGPRRGPHAPDALPLPTGPPSGRRRTRAAPAPLRARLASAPSRGRADV